MSLITAMGLKNSVRVFVRYPSILLTPMISLVAFGPMESKQGNCCSTKKIGVSYWYTFVNFLITMCCSNANYLMFRRETLMNNFWGFFKCLYYVQILLMVSFLLMLSLMIMDYSKKCFCSWYQRRYFPIIERSLIHVDFMDVLVDDCIYNHQEIEMSDRIADGILIQ